jgi:hypothetical protein
VQNKMADYANANPPYRLMALPQSSSPRLGVATSLETPTPTSRASFARLGPRKGEGSRRSRSECN